MGSCGETSKLMNVESLVISDSSIANTSALCSWRASVNRVLILLSLTNRWCCFEWFWFWIKNTSRIFRMVNLRSLSLSLLLFYFNVFICIAMLVQLWI